MESNPPVTETNGMPTAEVDATTPRDCHWAVIVDAVATDTHDHVYRGRDISGGFTAAPGEIVISGHVKGNRRRRSRNRIEEEAAWIVATPDGKTGTLVAIARDRARSTKVQSAVSAQLKRSREARVAQTLAELREGFDPERLRALENNETEAAEEPETAQNRAERYIRSTERNQLTDKQTRIELLESTVTHMRKTQAKPVAAGASAQEHADTPVQSQVPAPARTTMEQANGNAAPGDRQPDPSAPPEAPYSPGDVAPAPERAYDGARGLFVTGMRNAAEVIAGEAPPETDQPSIRRLIRYKNALHREADTLLREAKRIERQIAMRSNSA